MLTAQTFKKINEADVKKKTKTMLEFHIMIVGE